MTTFEFLQILTENFALFFLCVIPSVIIYILIANRLGKSWMNPVKFNVFTAGIGIGVACFLFFMGEAPIGAFTYIIISSIIFWGILWLFYPKDSGHFRLRIKGEDYYSRNLFIIFYISNILLQLFSYSRFGIPLFNDNSRLATYTGSGGYGVIIRITGFLSIYLMFYIFSRYINNKGVQWGKFLLLFSPLIIFGILSGSRSSFIGFIFGFWGYKKFYKGEEILLSKYKGLLVPFVAVAVLTFGLQQSSNLLGSILSFAERVAACGDLYWYALPNDTWADVTIKTPYKDLLVSFLGPLRLMAESSADVPIGFQLTQLVNNDFDKMTGPVELFPVASLIYFGYGGGIIMVVIQAFLACFFYKVFYKKCDSLIFASLFYFAFFKCVDFLGPLRTASGQLFDILLNMAFVVFLCFILAAVRTVLKRPQRQFNNK